MKSADKFYIRLTYHGLTALVLVSMFIIQGCKTTKLVPEGQYLLVKNKLKTQDTGTLFNKALARLEDEKSQYIKHKPNRRILFLGRFHLGLYNLGSSKKHPEKNEEKWFRRILRNYGEAPVLLDTAEIEKSEQNLQNFLFSKGYFDCRIDHEIKLHKKKATVTYFVSPSQPYIIDRVSLFADDEAVDRFLNSHMKSGLLQAGQAVDIELIGRERNRLTLLMRNNGYFDFTKDYIDFELDTIGKAKNRVHILITISNKSSTELFHTKTIRKVSVYFENDSETHVPSDIIKYADINFQLNGFPVKPHVIAKNISILKGDLFRASETELTYTRLSEFAIFKFIDIEYIASEEDSVRGLDAIITLRTNYRQSFTIEPQGIVSQLNRIESINRGNSYGVANNLIWTHRNLFRNAELFEISATTRIEAQIFRDSTDNLLKYFNPAYQQSLNLSLSIPTSSVLKPLESWRQVKSIRTNFNLSFLFEKNPDYLRRILPLTYQYQVQTQRSTWFLNVLEMSFSRNTLTIDITGRADSAFIQRLFSNNLVTSTGLNFLFTDKNTTKSKTHFYVRTNLIEFGGNLHRMIRRFADQTKAPDTSYRILKVDYYQYVRSEIDARCSTLLDENQSTVIRFNLGITYPYGNQLVVPFDKLFFIGGSNSLRAWRPRTVGPGSYYESSKSFRIDRAGNFILQSNAEYRFDIFNNRLEGALFIDAGNVWLIRDVNNTDPSKLLKPARILDDIALNTGVGLRFDFQFFLFRLDWGMQMKNPELSAGEKWVIRDFAKNDYFTKYSILNFGIGYPF